MACPREGTLEYNPGVGGRSSRSRSRKRRDGTYRWRLLAPLWRECKCAMALTAESHTNRHGLCGDRPGCVSYVSAALRSQARGKSKIVSRIKNLLPPV